MKDYCDPKSIPNDHFNGWSTGGQNMCDVPSCIERLVALRFDGLLEKGVHDVMHLGTSKLEWATLLTDIQRAVRKYPMKTLLLHLIVSIVQATANGQIPTVNLKLKTELNGCIGWFQYR